MVRARDQSTLSISSLSPTHSRIMFSRSLTRTILSARPSVCSIPRLALPRPSSRLISSSLPRSEPCPSFLSLSLTRLWLTEMSVSQRVWVWSWQRRSSMKLRIHLKVLNFQNSWTNSNQKVFGLYVLQTLEGMERRTDKGRGSESRSRMNQDRMKLF